MSFISNISCQCANSELEIFSVPPTQTSILSGQFISYKPLASLSDDAPVEFSVPGHGEDYLDLPHTFLELKVKIFNSDNTAITSTDKVAPVNNFLHSLFNQIDVFLNQKLVTSPSHTYPYRAYIENVLNYNPAAKESHLTSCLWYKDTPGHMDSVNGDENEGFESRRRIISNSKSVDLIGHLHCDIFNLERLLLNNIEMRVKLIRAKDSFCLMAEGTTFKVHIEDATLFVRKVSLNPSIKIAHSHVLQKATAKYPINRVQMKIITFPRGILNKTVDNLFLGQIPKRIIIGFVTNSAFNGDYSKNPFNFRHFNINFLCLYVDGKQIPSSPLQPDFQKNLSLRAYQTLYDNTGIQYQNDGNGISREDYGNGYTLFAFDLTPDLSAHTSTHWNLLRHGTVRMEVHFSTALPETVNSVVYGEFQNLLEIDKDRNVIIDYTN